MIRTPPSASRPTAAAMTHSPPAKINAVTSNSADMTHFWTRSISTSGQTTRRSLPRLDGLVGLGHQVVDRAAGQRGAVGEDGRGGVDAALRRLVHAVDDPLLEALTLDARPDVGLLRPSGHG